MLLQTLESGMPVGMGTWGHVHTSHLNPISTRGADYAHPIYWFPHQVLTAILTLFQPGGQIMLTLY